MYEKCGYAVISRTADHPLHWIMRHVLKSFLGYPDWNMMAKQLMTSKGSKATNFTSVRVPISITATSGTQHLSPIPETDIVKGSIKTALAADRGQSIAAGGVKRAKPRIVFSFTAASPSPHAYLGSGQMMQTMRGQLVCLQEGVCLKLCPLSQSCCLKKRKMLHWRVGQPCCPGEEALLNCRVSSCPKLLLNLLTSGPGGIVP